MALYLPSACRTLVLWLSRRGLDRAIQGAAVVRTLACGKLPYADCASLKHGTDIVYSLCLRTVVSRQPSVPVFDVDHVLHHRLDTIEIPLPWLSLCGRVVASVTDDSGTALIVLSL